MRQTRKSSVYNICNFINMLVQYIPTIFPGSQLRTATKLCSTTARSASLNCSSKRWTSVTSHCWCGTCDTKARPSSHRWTSPSSSRSSSPLTRAPFSSSKTGQLRAHCSNYSRQLAASTRRPLCSAGTSRIRRVRSTATTSSSSRRGRAACMTPSRTRPPRRPRRSSTPAWRRRTAYVSSPPLSRSSARCWVQV